MDVDLDNMSQRPEWYIWVSFYSLKGSDRLHQLMMFQCHKMITAE